MKSSFFWGKLANFGKAGKTFPSFVPPAFGAQLVNRPANVYTESMTPSGTNRVKAGYLLPCSCGAKIVVEPRQAGQTVHCACGKSLTVPTMLEMAKLERAEAVEDRAQGKNPPDWGVPQILIVLGIVGLLVAGAFAAIAVHLRPPPRICDLNPETVQREIQREVERWPAVKVVLEYWNMKKQGLGRGILAAEDIYNRNLAIYHLWWGIAAAVGLLGVGLLWAGVTRRRALMRP